MYILFNILFCYRLSQDTEYSSLCHTGRPYCLSILYMIVCICQPQPPHPTLPLGNHKSVLYVPESVSIS